MRPLPTFCLLVLAVALTNAAAVSANERPRDRHVGYYYPEPQIREIYRSSVRIARSATPRSRAAFAVGITLEQKKRTYAPTYHLFAKGKDKEKMIIVATEADRYTTLYRLRALLAAMTSEARSTPLFNRAPNPERLTFLDFCKLMGFARLTVSDGDTVALQIDIE